MPRISLLAAMTLAAALSGALAQEKVIVTEQAQHAYDPNAISCRRADPPIGSRIGRKQVCHTAARWKEIHMDSAEAVRIMQERDAWNYHKGP